MTIIVDESSNQIARRLRLERDARGWSLADLGQRSGVSKATISKIERREVSPTAAVLIRLAAAFDLTLAGLLVRAESARERVSREGDQAVWCDPQTGYRRQQIFVAADNPLEIIQVEMPAEQQVDLPAASYAHIRQVLWVRRGALVVVEGADRHQLAAGDCLGFGPPGPVRLANETRSPCQYTVVLVRG